MHQDSFPWEEQKGISAVPVETGEFIYRRATTVPYFDYQWYYIGHLSPSVWRLTLAVRDAALLALKVLTEWPFSHFHSFEIILRSYSCFICANYFILQSNTVPSKSDRLCHDVMSWCSWPNYRGRRIIFCNEEIMTETWKVLDLGGQYWIKEIWELRLKKSVWLREKRRVMTQMILGGSSSCLKPVEGVCKIHVAINHYSCSNHPGPSTKLLKNIIDSFVTVGKRIPAKNLDGWLHSQEIKDIEPEYQRVKLKPH